MTIDFYCVNFIKKLADGTFSANVSTGFTNDKELWKEIKEIATQKTSDKKSRARWAGDDSAVGQIADVEALKEKIGEDAEETSKGCWSTPGCKFWHYVRNE